MPPPKGRARGTETFLPSNYRPAIEVSMQNRGRKVYFSRKRQTNVFEQLNVFTELVTKIASVRSFRDYSLLKIVLGIIN